MINTRRRSEKLYDDAQVLLKRVLDNKLLTASGVIGFWPANSVGDDIEIYTDDTRTTLLTRIHTLRQQAEKAKNEPYYALSDFIAPKDSGIPDYWAALP